MLGTKKILNTTTIIVFCDSIPYKLSIKGFSAIILDKKSYKLDKYK